MTIGNSSSDNLLLAIGRSLKLLVIPLILLSSCKNDYDEAVKREIIIVSRNDNVIDKNDYENIKALVLQYKDRSANLEKISKSDNLICNFIKDFLKVEAKKYITGSVKFDCPIEGPPPELSKIRFYIETSMSMAGYMNHGTEFQTTVNNIVGILRSGYGQDKIVPNTIVDTITHYDDLDDFRYGLTNSTFGFAGHSPIDRIFQQILNHSGSNDISFFITDAIMSGSNNDVRNNPEFNVEQATLLMNNIRARFDDVKERFAVIIYGFKSKFNSNSAKSFYYYTYRNDKILENFNKRPFYVFMIGNKVLLKQTNNLLRRDSFFNPEKVLDFGIQNEPVKRYTLLHSHLPPHPRSSCLFKDDNSVKCAWNPSAADPVKFAIGLNLSALPDYALRESYLEDHLNIKVTNNIRLSEAKPPISKISTVKLDPVVEQKKCNILGCTHFLNLTLSDMFVPNETINVTISDEEDNWYEGWSCDNDLDIALDPSLQEKTFNLKWLIYGIRSAYTSGNLVEINIPVIR